jgi:predicted DNA-binding ribbon-helix-helix protein
MTPPGRAGIVKRSLVIAGHRTSVSLEEPFWEALKEMAAARGISIARAVAAIDETRGEQNRSSAIRVAVLAYVRSAPRG